MPRASASRCSDHKIYKRITATFNVDEKYQATVAELESQGFGERKRARAGIYLSPYGDAQFEERKQDETNGQEMLDKARGRSDTCFLVSSLTASFSSLPLLLPE